MPTPISVGNLQDRGRFLETKATSHEQHNHHHQSDRPQKNTQSHRIASLTTKTPDRGHEHSTCEPKEDNAVKTIHE
jgi:hypothetical protein